MSDIIVSKQDANQVLRLAFDDATQALRTTGASATTVTVIQPDGSLLHTTVDASALPTGASTAAKQDTGNTSVASIDTKTPALVSGRVPVDGSGVTQPISAASLPLPTGAATAANQSTANASLSSIDTKLTSPLTVTGTVAVSNPGLTDTQLRASAVPVSIASSPLPSGAATSANQATEIASLSSIDGKTPSLGQALAAASVPVVLTAAQLSTLTPLSTVAVTGPLTDVQLRATAVPVSLSSTTITGSVAVTGPLTDTQLRATPVPVSGTVSTGGLTDTQLRATAVPVSGTVTANAGTNLNTSALNLETTQTAMSAKLPATIGQKAMAASLAVVLASDQSSVPVAATLTAETTKVIGTVNISAGQTVTATFAAKTVSTAPVYTDYTSTSVTTAAYTQLVASTSAAITHLSIFDSSGQAMILATGAAASEVIKLYIPPGGGEFDLAIPISTRISIKALTATASSGYNLLNMLS